MSTRPVLAVVSVVPLTPPTNGFAVRASRLVRELAASWDVVLAAPVASDGELAGWGLRHVERLEITAPWAYLPAHHEARLRVTVRALVKRWQPDTALFLCGAEYLAVDLPGLPPSVADHVDCLTLIAAETARAQRTWRARMGAARDALAMARFERALVRRLAVTIAAGARDASALRRLGGRASVRLVTNGVEALPSARWEARAPEPTVAFSGILDFPPNEDAACFLAREVWPQVRRLVPDARLRIVGRRPTAAVRALAADPSVTLHTDVPDVRVALQAAWIAAAPMRLGSGVKNKVLEAWGAGRAVVMTPYAVNGLRLPPGHDGLLADGAMLLAPRLASLLLDEPRARALGEGALAFAREELSWAAAGRRVSAILAEVAQAHGAFVPVAPPPVAAQPALGHARAS